MSIRPSKPDESAVNPSKLDEFDTTPKASQENPVNKSRSSPQNSESSNSSEDSDTETEMSDRRQDKYFESSKTSGSKSSSKSSSKSGSKSSSKSGSKSSKSKKDDWSDVVEPDERRRIQNRIAQRKFREKTKEQKETKERDAENHRCAGHAYSTPDPRDMPRDYDESGLPWGSISFKHVVERGHTRERDSQQGSHEPSYLGYGGSGRGSESRSR